MPQLHSETFTTALRKAAGFDPDAPRAPIEERVAQIPSIDSLDDLPGLGDFVPGCLHWERLFRSR